jgi:aconitate hydratase
MPLWDAAQRYRAHGDSVVVIGGERYGMGSSRDWAAKAQRLLGARAVLADSFERIHRSNLIGMGVLPLLIPAGLREELQGMAPGDTLHIDASPANIHPQAPIPVTLLKAGQPALEFTATAAVETAFETRLLAHGGVIPAILAQNTQAA